MADTRQIVNWSIERKCAFRKGVNWFLPNETFKQLADLQTIARAYDDNQVVDGICVTSWTMGQDNSQKHYDIPYDGFCIEDQISKFGGMEAVHKTCRECEANADNKLNTKIAGCFGSLDVWPDSEELNEQLWDIIERDHLENRLRAAFSATNPLWYGFWIESPLRRIQSEFLYDLIGAACDYDDPEDNEVVHFLNALKVAINWELPVHVSLAPLGHVDMGWYTVFPHCPRCKANAPVGRWKEEFPDEPYKCKVCDHIFNPNEHHSMEKYEHAWESTSLEQQLGETRYEEFTKQFLLHQGCTEQQAEEVIDDKNNGPILRQIEEVCQKRKATIQELRKDDQPINSTTEYPHKLHFALNDDVELELVLVPSGEFLMGSANADEQSDESPQHIVRFDRPFYIGSFPITQSQWQTIMGSSSFHYQGQDLPVDQVSWFDCQEFCEKLCHRLRRVIRLPSEAEWEYACRAGTTTPFAFGESLSVQQANFTPYDTMINSQPDNELQEVLELEQLAEHDADERADGKCRPTPVGTYPPNAWGIYDMHGNVNEWCEDVWHDNYQGAPTDGSAWLRDESKQPFRVARGGWCSATEFVCTSSARQQLRADAGSRKENESDDEENEFLSELFEMMYMPHGFRVVCEI